MGRMLMEYLVNSLWQAPLLAAGAWLALRAGRPAPRAQHAVWVGALALMVATPLLSLRQTAPPVAAAPVVPIAPASAQSAGGPAQSMGAPSIATLLHRDAWDVNPSSAPPIVTQKIAVHPHLPAPLDPKLNNAAGLTPVQVTSAPPVAARWLRMREFRLSAGATHRIVELYLAFALFAGFRLLWSWFAARRIVAEATPAILSAAESLLLDACCERSGVRRPRVLVSERTASPLVVGVRRPALLLPDSLTAGSPERELGPELEAVLWHELAHVRRRDYLMNLICRIWAVPVAYHPATSWVHGRIRQTREMVCDGIAAEAMESSVGYARCLVGLAQGMQLASGLGIGIGVGMFDSGVLEERVTELIGTKAAVSGRMRLVRRAIAVATMLVVLTMAAIFHVRPTMAQAASGFGSFAESEPAMAVPQTQAPNPQPAPAAVVAKPVVTVHPVPNVKPVTLVRSAIDVQPAVDVKPLVDINPAITVPAMAELQAAPPLQPAAPAAPAAQAPAAAPETPALPMAPARPDRFESEHPLTPEDRARIDQAIATAKQQIQTTLNSPEFKKQIEDAHRQALDAVKQLNSPEFQKQIEDAKRQAMEASGPQMQNEIRKQMEDARKQIAEVQRQLNGAEFQKQIAGELKENMKALKDLDSPEFRKQIGDATRQATEAARQLDSPEFKQQMEEARKQIQAATDQMREAMRSERALDREKREKDREKIEKEKDDKEKTKDRRER